MELVGDYETRDYRIEGSEKWLEEPTELRILSLSHFLSVFNTFDMLI
jgi:hypothetical protein